MFKNYQKYLFILIINLIINEILSKDIKMNLNKKNGAIKNNSNNNIYYNNLNNNNNYNNDNDNSNDDITDSDKTETVASSVIKNLTWDCANNSSCIKTIAKNIIKNYENGENINFELFSIEKLPKIDKSNNNNNDNNNWDFMDNEGRSISSIAKFFKENSIQIPIGPMVLNVKRSDDDSEFMEINLLGQRVWNQTAQEKGLGRRHKVIKRRGKKHLQVIIPMYLAANAFGWTLLAVKAVTLLAVKAILISKLAFLVASSIVVKSFLDNSHKMMYPQHFPPPLSSYNMMDYGIQAAQSIPDALEEQYHSHIGLTPQQHIVASPNILSQSQPQQHSAAGSSHVVYAIQANATHPQYYPLTSLTGLGGIGPHIKRRDQWTGVRRPPLINSAVSKEVKTK